MRDVPSNTGSRVSMASRVATSQLKEPRVMQKVGTSDPTPKSWHEWPHHLTPSATKRHFPWSRSQKITSFRRKKKVARCGGKILHEWPHPKILHEWPHALTPRAQKDLFKGRQGQQELIFRGKTVLPHLKIFTYWKQLEKILLSTCKKMWNCNTQWIKGRFKG